jgi:transcriptional regulator with XRE-family HTH domain
VDDEDRELALRWLLKEKRLLAGLTQKQLAERMGRVQSFVSDSENGQHRVSVVEFLRFCDALELDPRSAIRRVATGKPAPKTKPRLPEK